MKITAYDGPDFKTPIADGKFVVHLNPEGYSYNYLIKYKDDQAQGNSSSQPKYTKTAPEEIEFEFIFDKTASVYFLYKVELSFG